ncbi:furin-like protease 1 isoform X4 [Drosophila ananassae]|uniref:furin-like protease 1 isoform X4 n=1 Tax=Drosophila ananassae TaxID=7217 RepID=UPI0013A5C2EF|nr:furin-like protease 1 isoform X4 [Drosophila ananassae]
MKNDVVRWSGEPTSNTTSSSSSSSKSSSSSSFNCKSIHNRGCHKHKSKSNKLNARKLGQHAARSCQQRAAPEQQQTIIECDIRNFNLNCNLFKTSYLTQCQPRLSGSSSSRNRNKAASRHLARTKAWLLTILQISAVVFLCNFNVGFVAGSVASSAAPPPAPPSPPASQSRPLKLDPNGQSPVLPPYVLDYETDGRAKLTPSNSNSNGNGKYGSSGSGGQNQIAGHYTHTWAVHIPDGDNGKADAVAKDHGFVNLGKVSFIRISHHPQARLSNDLENV